jgi:hypothetical protein
MVQSLSELGVILLMFSLGLEFRLRRVGASLDNSGGGSLAPFRSAPDLGVCGSEYASQESLRLPDPFDLESGGINGLTDPLDLLGDLLERAGRSRFLSLDQRERDTRYRTDSAQPE